MTLLRKPNQTGHDRNHGLARFQSVRNRRIALRCAFQLPVIIWAVSTYALARQVFDVGVVGSLAASAAVGYVVAVVETMLVASPRSAWLFVARLILTLVMSILGATALDIALFEKDIAAQIRASAEAAYAKKREPEVTALLKQVEQKKTDWQKALDKANDEAQCRGSGSGRCGLGKIAAELLTQAGIKREDYQQAEQALQTLRAAIKQGSITAGLAAPRNAGVLGRVTAFHDFVRDNPPAFWLWILLLTMLSFLESSVLIVRYVGGESLAERVERLEEKRLLTMLERHVSPLAGQAPETLGRA